MSPLYTNLQQFSLGWPLIVVAEAFEAFEKLRQPQYIIKAASGTTLLLVIIQLSNGRLVTDQCYPCCINVLYYYIIAAKAA